MSESGTHIIGSSVFREVIEEEGVYSCKSLAVLTQIAMLFVNMVNDESQSAI